MALIPGLRDGSSEDGKELADESAALGGSLLSTDDVLLHGEDDHILLGDEEEVLAPVAKAVVQESCPLVADPPVQAVACCF